MLIIDQVLGADDLKRVREGLAAATFAPGKKTARGEARAVKANRQAAGGDPKVAALGLFVRRALERNALFRLYAQPARWSAVMFNRYGSGESYGLHLDDAVMDGEGGRLRTDLSFTLFLSDPDSYEGGELVVDDLEGERAVKPPAGAVAVYTSGALHRVEAVASGERLAAVGWVQSLIRRADEREVLFDLGGARSTMPAGEGRMLLDKAIGKLVRLWGEP